MSDEQVLAQLRRMYLEGYKDEPRARLKRIEELAKATGVESWSHLALGHLAALDGSSDDFALSEFEKASECDPTFAYPWYGKGSVFSEQGKLDDALAAYDKAIALDPTIAFPWNSKGNVLDEQKKYDEALAAYERAIALDPAFPYPWHGKGNVLAEQKEYEEALTAYDKALALDATYAHSWNGKGDVLHMQKELDKALAAYDRALGLNQTFANPWNGKGNVLCEKNKFPEALAAYERAIALDPTFAAPWNGKGNVLAKQKKYVEALASYDKGIDLDAAYAYCWYGKGTVLREQKKYDEALAAYDRAIALDRTDAYPWNGKGNVLCEQKKYDEALVAYEKAIVLDPTFACPWNGKGTLLCRQGKYDEALVAYDKAIALDPTVADSHYNRGVLLWQIGRHDQSHSAFQRALELGLAPEWESIARMWERRTAAAVETAKRKEARGGGEQPSADAEFAEEPTPAALGADVYQTLKDLRLLEEVENSRKKMKEALAEALAAPRRFAATSDEGTLFVLRDWNSYTPILPPVFRPESPASPTTRMGGGYFLTWRGHGIAIDPGIDFVTQLYRRKLSIADIDSVVVTHCHLDHTRDVEALVDLNYRFNAHNGAKPGTPEFRQLRFFLSPAAHTKFAEYLKRAKCCSQPELMNGDGGLKSVSDHIEVRPVKVFHQDITSDDEAIGLVFVLKRGEHPRPILVGLTSDTRWEPSLGDKFAGCHVLLSHLGTIERPDEFCGQGLQNHLGLKGCYCLGQGVQPTLLIIGEFGEELLDSRLDITRVMQKYKPEKTTSVLAADSNLAIGLGEELTVLCCHPSCVELTPTKIPLKEVVPMIGDDGLFRYYCSKHSLTGG